MSQLLEDTQRLMAERDLDALLQQVCAVARRMTQARMASVGLVRENGEVENLVTLGVEPALTDELRALLLGQLQSQAEELRLQEEHTDFALSAARVGVSYRDLGSSWVEISGSLAALFGFPPGTRRVAQDDLYRLVHPEDAQMLRASVAKAVEDRSEIAFEFRLMAPESGTRWDEQAVRELVRII